MKIDQIKLFSEIGGVGKLIFVVNIIELDLYLIEASPLY